MPGLLALVGVLLVAVLVPVLLDRGAREHRFYRRRYEQWIGMLMRMEDAAVRFVNLWVIGRDLRVRSMIIFVVPTMGVCLLIGLQALFRFPGLVTVGLAGLLFAVHSSLWDEMALRSRGYRTSAVTVPATRWLLIFGFLARLALVLLAVLSAERGVLAVNNDNWLVGLGLLTAAMVLLGSAHLPSVHAERLMLSRAAPSVENDDQGILLLRSFADDNLRIRSIWTTLGRPHSILPLLFPRFEEFLASALLVPCHATLIM